MSPAHEPWHAMWTWGVVAAFVLYVAGTWLARGGAYSLRTAVAVAVVVQVMAPARRCSFPTTCTSTGRRRGS